MIFKEGRVQKKFCYIISFPLEEKKKKNKPTKVASLPTWQVNHSMPFPHTPTLSISFLYYLLCHLLIRKLFILLGPHCLESHHILFGVYNLCPCLEHPELKQGSPCILHAANCIFTLGCARKLVLKIPSQGSLPDPKIN